MKIKNREQILLHGDIVSKRIVLDITERTLQKLDAYERIKSMTSYDSKTQILTIGQKTWNLNNKRNVYLIGAGKACNHMARAVDEVLGDDGED